MVDNSAFLFCEVMLAFFIGALTGAAILQLSCVLYDLFAGVSSKRAAARAAWLSTHVLKSDADWENYERIATYPGVPRPAFDRAVRIVFLATLINVPGTFLLFRLARLAGKEHWANYGDLLLIACLAVPMGILVLAVINTAMLPTNFGKGLLVSLLSHLLAAILASVIVLIVLTFGPHNIISFPL